MTNTHKAITTSSQTPSVNPVLSSPSQQTPTSPERHFLNLTPTEWTAGATVTGTGVGVAALVIDADHKQKELKANK